MIQEEEAYEPTIKAVNCTDIMGIKKSTENDRKI